MASDGVGNAVNVPDRPLTVAVAAAVGGSERRRNGSGRGLGHAARGAIDPRLRDLVGRYVESLRASGAPPDRVVLYGPHAHGVQSGDGSVHLLVVSRAFEAIDPLEPPRILDRAGRSLPAPVHALWTTPAALAAAPEGSYLQQILRDGVRLA